MAKATLDEGTHNSPLEGFIETALFRNSITTLIVLNAIVLGVLTYADSLPPGLVVALNAFDIMVTAIFVVEIGLKLIVYRLDFFKLGWNWFDFIVVGISLIPAATGFSVLRALRVLRVLRLLHVIPTMRRITEALLSALPGMGAILAILALVFYVSTVMATYLFREAESEYFSHLGASALAMFEVLTMEGWNDIMREVMEDYPWAWAFFIPFILFTVWAILNLFVAVIVDSLQESATQKEHEHLEEMEAEEVKRHREIIEQIAALRMEINELKQRQS